MRTEPDFLEEYQWPFLGLLCAFTAFAFLERPRGENNAPRDEERAIKKRRPVPYDKRGVERKSRVRRGISKFRRDNLGHSWEDIKNWVNCNNIELDSILEGRFLFAILRAGVVNTSMLMALTATALLVEHLVNEGVTHSSNVTIRAISNRYILSVVIFGISRLVQVGGRWSAKKLYSYSRFIHAAACLVVTSKFLHSKAAAVGLSGDSKSDDLDPLLSFGLLYSTLWSTTCGSLSIMDSIVISALMNAYLYSLFMLSTSGQGGRSGGLVQMQIVICLRCAIGQLGIIMMARSRFRSTRIAFLQDGLLRLAIQANGARKKKCGMRGHGAKAQDLLSGRSMLHSEDEFTYLVEESIGATGSSEFSCSSALEDEGSSASASEREDEAEYGTTPGEKVQAQRQWASLIRPTPWE